MTFQSELFATLWVRQHVLWGCFNWHLEEDWALTTSFVSKPCPLIAQELFYFQRVVHVLPGFHLSLQGTLKSRTWCSRCWGTWFMVDVNHKISWVFQESEQAGVQPCALTLLKGSPVAGKTGRKQDWDWLKTQQYIYLLLKQTKKSPRKSIFWNCWVRGNETFCYDSDVLFLNYFCFYANKKLK